MSKFIALPIAFALIIATISSSVGADDKDDAIKADMKLLQGNWLMQSFENNGNKLPDEQAQMIKLTIKGNKYMVDLGERKFEATFKIDPSQKPKAIDVTMMQDDQKAVTFGIYEVTKDTFKICRAMEAGKDRPTEFKTAAGSATGMATYKREKK